MGEGRIDVTDYCPIAYQYTRIAVACTGSRNRDTVHENEATISIQNWLIGQMSRNPGCMDPLDGVAIWIHTPALVDKIVTSPDDGNNFEMNISLAGRSWTPADQTNPNSTMEETWHESKYIIKFLLSENGILRVVQSWNRSSSNVHRPWLPAKDEHDQRSR